MLPNRRCHRLAVIILGNLILALSALGFFTLLNNLAVIALVSEATLAQIGRDEEKVRQRVHTIPQLATDTASHLRQFLWVLEDQHRTWEAI